MLDGILGTNFLKNSERIFEEIVIAISGGIFEGSLGVSSEKLLQKSLEVLIGLIFVRDEPAAGCKSLQ